MPKNPAAVRLGKLSGAKSTIEQRLARARRGGHASAKSLTKAQRKTRAQTAARARWAKAKGKK